MKSAETLVAGPNAGLLDWLVRNHVDYELREHPLTFTARETARAEGLDPRLFVKALGVETDEGRKAIVAIDAADHLDLVKARRVLSAGRVQLLREEELLDLWPGCDAGTMPPVGDPVGLKVYADFALRDDSEITFHAGSHRYTVRVERATWERAAHPTYADLAEDHEREPAWARS